MSDPEKSEATFTSIDELVNEVFPKKSRKPEVSENTVDEAREYGHRVAEKLLEKYRARIAERELGD